MSADAIRDEQLVENVLTWSGMRWVHVIRMGKPVEIGNWMKMIPPECVNLFSDRAWYEKELDIHHLGLTWQHRGLVTIEKKLVERTFEGIEEDWVGAMWYIEDGGTLSEGADWAACLHRLRLGRWPDVCLVREIPKGAPERFEIEGLNKRKYGLPSAMRLLKMEWLPRRFVVAGNYSSSSFYERDEKEVVYEGG